jgi:hypothetical protein
MKRLLVAAALAPLVFAASARAGEITGADKGTHSTSAEGDITVDSGASITPPTSATSGTVAVLLNSNNNVTNNGAITVSETTTGITTNQGINTGPFANGSDRFGIQVAGSGPFTGDITTGGSSAITVIGENSAGIDVETGLDGSIIDNGSITITGGNANTTDVSYGLLVGPNAFVTGDIAIGGAISAQGQNVTGAAIDGNVGGSVVVSSNISATGFRDATPPVRPSALAALKPDQTLIGGPALEIGASVDGVVDIEASTPASGNVAATSGGSLTVFGSAPALLIGGASPITIGSGNATFSVTVGGTVTGSGDYPNVSATGIQIGGINPLSVASGGVDPGGNFSSVTITGGLHVTGTVTATATQTVAGGGGAATGIIIGAGATVATIDVSGTVSAVGANTLTPADAPGPDPVIGILFQPGAAQDTTVLINSGTINAEVTGVAGTPGLTESKGGVVGNAVAIFDAGDGLRAIINTGNITASITPAIAGAATQGTIRSIVADNSAPLLIVQCVAVANGACAPAGNATFSPNIIGEVDLSQGTGAVTFDLWGGNVTGGIAFGSSPDNFLDIENGGIARGPFTVADGGSVALNINDGVLFDTVPGNVSVSVLNLGAHGSLVVTAAPGEPDGSVFNVTGNATIADGATVGLSLSVPLTGPETFTVIQSGGNLTVGNVSTALLGQLPILESGTINVTNDSVSITATPKTVTQLGLNPAETAEFAAFIKALPTDAAVSSDVLSKLTLPEFIRVYNQFLPDYSGGPFEDLVVGQQEVARAIADPPARLQSDGPRGWVQEIGYMNHEPTSSAVNGYQGLGFGFASGLEEARGRNVIGVTGVFLTTGVQDQTQPHDQALSATAFEAGLYWRYGESDKGLSAFAAVNGGVVTFGSHRFLIDAANGNDLLATTAGQIVSRESKASWLGGLASAHVGVAYQVTAGRLYFQPEVVADYVALFESSYREHGGGTAFDLNVAPGTSSQADVQADIVLGMNFGQTLIWRPQLTFGYRAVVAGGPASTVASFQGGQSFTLDPQFSNKSGFLARIGLRASSQYADFSADAGGQFSSTYQTYNARAVARFLF